MVNFAPRENIINRYVMKKVIFTLFLTVSFVVSANSQDYETSLGLRAGVPYGAYNQAFLRQI